MLICSLPFTVAVALILVLVSASPTRRALTPYAPVNASCPSNLLVRPANAISAKEKYYAAHRYAKATAALSAWLNSTNGSFSGYKPPVIALTTSGGGYRSLLTGAGVIQAFDSRDSKTGVSGLFQALTYQAGLSGGAWLLSSLAGNNYPTVTTLRDNLWETAFQNSLLVPQILVSSLASTVYDAVVADLFSKSGAGFAPTLVDPYGRLLSYQLLLGPDGGVSDTMSGIASGSNFTLHHVPYPIITALGVAAGECLPTLNATQYEFHPYEFGSWDTGVSAFTPTTYLGTALSNGYSNGTCKKGFDNLGYVLGASSNLFNAACGPVPPVNTSSNTELGVAEDLSALVSIVHPVGERENFGTVPNPFLNYPPSSLVSSQAELQLVDGGEAYQNNPIWPILHRAVDIMIVNDNSADTTDNFPNGTDILTTYALSVSAGLKRMPAIPSVNTFVSLGLNQKPTFFGCNDTTKTTIIYLPNYNYTFPSNQSTTKLLYLKNETIGMIANGGEVATQGGDRGWPLCLACGIMKKAGGTLPSGCTACYQKYCYN